MSLIDRLGGIAPSPVPEDFKKLSLDAFWACMYEVAQGQATKAQLVNYFELDAAEETELNWIIDRYNAQPNASAKAKFIELLRVLFILAESKVPGYVTNAQLTARINAV